MGKKKTIEARFFSLENFKELGNTLIFALIIAGIFRSLLFEPFYIPSGSMKSNLLEGDFILVSKYSYGYSKYSFPFAMIPFKGRVMEKEPESGDVIVFRLPSDPKINYVKRLIGVPGDKVQMLDGILHINGKAVNKKLVGNFVDIDRFGQEQIIPRYLEELENGKKYYMDIVLSKEKARSISASSSESNVSKYSAARDEQGRWGSWFDAALS